MMAGRLKRIICFLMAVSIAVLAGGCFLLPEEEAVLAPPLVEPQEIVYRTEAVTRGDMELKQTFTAFFTPLVNINMFFTKSSGRIQTYNVSLGKEVTAGDILVELENESVKKKIRDQELVISQLKSKLADIENRKPDEYTLRLAELDLEAAKNVYNDILAEYNDVRVRYSENTVNTTLADQLAALEKKLRDQKIVIERAELRLAQVSTVDNSYDLEQATINLQSALNTLGDLSTELENTVMRTPVDGRISWMRPINVGESVNTYTTLLTVADPTQIVLQYDSARSADLPVGMEVSIVYNKETFKGIVESNPSTNPLNDDGSKPNYARFSLLDFDFAQATLGSNAQITAVLDSRQNVVKVAKNRVNYYGSRYYVNVLVDGLKEERDVQIGLETATEVEIISGLNEGDLIIIN